MRRAIILGALLLCSATTNAEVVTFDGPNCVADGNDVWISYGLTKDPIGLEESAKSYAVRLAHARVGSADLDGRADVHDTAAAPFFIHPQMVLEDGGALDFVYYAGNKSGDPAGAYRWARAENPQAAVLPSTVVETPVTFLTDRDSLEWLGDYTGAIWTGKQLYTSYVVNTMGIAHIAFTKLPAP